VLARLGDDEIRMPVGGLTGNLPYVDAPLLVTDRWGGDQRQAFVRLAFDRETLYGR
jgi:hypothetical protein